MSLTLQHNRLLFFTNHNFVCYGFMAYHIYVRVISALHPKKNGSQSQITMKKAIGTTPNLKAWAKERKVAKAKVEIETTSLDLQPKLTLSFDGTCHIYNL